MSGLKPFFTYYGGKWRLAPKYSPPVYAKIIEPFAGAAGYSLRHHEHDVTLYDVNPAIIATWQYLIKATANDIAALPLLEPGQPVTDLSLAYGPQCLIGWHLNKGTVEPGCCLSAWGRDTRYADQFWGENMRERIANQVEKINHWQAHLLPYDAAPHEVATWFIDPPYQASAGRHYTHHTIDYTKLGAWVRELKGQTIVCENTAATWLPFEHLADAHVMMGAQKKTKRSAEGVYYG